MSAGEIVAVAGAVGIGLVTLGLLAVFNAAVRTLGTMRTAVDDVRRATVPLLDDVHTAVRRADADLVRVDGLLETAESISGTVDSASRLAYTAFASPMVKLIALFSGIARATRRLRRK